MRRVPDLRFEADEWPIESVIPPQEAKTWMAHLIAEIEERGWDSSAFSQLHAAENSGTLTVYTASGQSPPRVDIVWEKLRGEALRLRARTSGNPVLSIDAAREIGRAHV